MTNKERAVRADSILRRQKAESILRRQNSGKLSKWDAAAEFDKLLDESSGDLHFYSDTTGLRDTWDGRDVMVFPHRDSTFPRDIRPSNTAIITQGPERGRIVLQLGETETDAQSQVLDLWGTPDLPKFLKDGFHLPEET